MKTIIAFIVAWTVGLLAFYGTIPGSPARAAWFMLVGLMVIWVGGGAYASRRLYFLAPQIAKKFPGGWSTRFVLFATVLALLEEAITTALTNLTPFFGAPLGAAYITASANYFDVIFFHSVIVFVPMFIAWAWLLHRYDFRPAAAFLLFGVNGFCAEALSFGLNSTIQFYWVLVYGLMVYLPVAGIPPAAERGAHSPGIRAYVLGLTIPLIAAIPIAVIIKAIHPIGNHFVQ